MKITIQIVLFVCIFTTSGNTQVKTINNLKNDIKIVGGSQIKITPQGNTLTISSTAVNASGGSWTKDGNHLSNSNEGNIGIGTKNPITPLHVEGSGITISRNGFGNPFSLSKDANAPFGIFEGGSVNSYRMVIKEGNIGIGVTNPDAKLHVGGDIHIQEGNGLYFGKGKSDPNYFLRIYSAPTEWGMRLNGFSGVRLSTGQGDILNVFHDKVGIGTTNPSTKLEVKGTIKSDEVKADNIQTRNFTATDIHVQGSTFLGESSPAIKMKFLTGIYTFIPQVMGFEFPLSIPLGIDPKKVLSVSILVANIYPPNTGKSNLEYNYKVMPDGFINITSTAQGLDNEPIKILVIYAD